MTSTNPDEILKHAGNPTRLFAGNEWMEATGGSLPCARSTLSNAVKYSGRSKMAV